MTKVQKLFFENAKKACSGKVYNGRILIEFRISAISSCILAALSQIFLNLILNCIIAVQCVKKAVNEMQTLTKMSFWHT